MKFEETKLQGAFLVHIEPKHDDRGFFSRSFCQREFAEHGLNTSIAQANISWNDKAGTLRGMHFQYPPAAETKFIRCTRGALFDVIIDLRPESPTFGEHIGVELSADNHAALYVPERFGHGFMTLEDNTEAFYQVGEFYTPAEEGGIRWNDPTLGISWPRTPDVLSDKDKSWPDFGNQIQAVRAKMTTQQQATQLQATQQDR
jgi:dTDP-4-dehydrorhamnose 3,5-epimerase